MTKQKQRHVNKRSFIAWPLMLILGIMILMGVIVVAGTGAAMLTEVLLRVQAILPEVLTCPWGSAERKTILLLLVEEAEPKSLLFEAALRDADELTLRYALALTVGDEVREGELTRRLAEVSAGAAPEVKV